MAIGAWFEAAGFTQETYDAVSAAVGNQPPEGAVFHIAGPIEGGWRVIEVWESEEAQKAFQSERLNPAFQAVGASPVFPTYFEVYQTFPSPEEMRGASAA